MVLYHQPFFHIAGYGGGNAASLIGLGALEMGIQGCAEVAEPAFEIRRPQGLLAVKLAMDIHGVALVTLLAEQQFAPVVHDVREVPIEVYGGHIKEYGCHGLVGKQALVEKPHEFLHLLSTVKIGHGCFRSYFFFFLFFLTCAIRRRLRCTWRWVSLLRLSAYGFSLVRNSIRTGVPTRSSSRR